MSSNLNILVDVERSEREEGEIKTSVSGKGIDLETCELGCNRKQRTSWTSITSRKNTDIQVEGLPVLDRREILW